MIMIYKILIPTLTGFLASATTYVFAREKNRLENRARDIKNEQESAKYYQDLVDHLTGRLEYTINEFHKLEVKYKKLIDMNEELIADLRQYKQIDSKQDNT